MAESDYDQLFQGTAARYNATSYNINMYALLLAICARESNFDASVSTPEDNGDYSTGLMQLETATAKGLFNFGTLSDEEIRAQLLEPSFNLELAGKLVLSLIKRYNGDLRLLISAYNAGSAMFDIDGQIVYWDPEGFFQVLNGKRSNISGYDAAKVDEYPIANSDYVNYVLQKYRDYNSVTGEAGETSTGQKKTK